MLVHHSAVAQAKNSLCRAIFLEMIQPFNAQLIVSPPPYGLSQGCTVGFIGKCHLPQREILAFGFYKGWQLCTIGSDSLNNSDKLSYSLLT